MVPTFPISQVSGADDRRGSFATRWHDGFFTCPRHSGRGDLDFPVLQVWASLPFLKLPYRWSPARRTRTIDTGRAAVLVGGVWRSLYVPLEGGAWDAGLAEPWTDLLKRNGLPVYENSSPPPGEHIG